MTVWEAILLGLVQGFTEFLPVSSSGHLVLFQNILGISEEPLFFDTMVHVATLVAVCAVLWRDIWELIRRPIQKKMLALIIATLPAAICGVLLDDFLESLFGGSFLGFSFLITALLLVLAEQVCQLYRRPKNEITYPAALTMGAMQAVALLPGVSRSGSTLVGGLLSGTERNTATRFAFLMSIPVILGSALLQGYKCAKADSLGVELLPVLLGMVAAAVSGFFAVKFMLRLIQKHKLYGFAIYTGALGLLVLLDQLLLHVVF